MKRSLQRINYWLKSMRFRFYNLGNGLPVPIGKAGTYFRKGDRRQCRARLSPIINFVDHLAYGIVAHIDRIRITTEKFLSYSVYDRATIAAINPDRLPQLKPVSLGFVGRTI